MSRDDVEARLQDVLRGLAPDVPPDPVAWVRARVRRQRRALAVPLVVVAALLLAGTAVLLPHRVTSEPASGVGSWPARGDLRGDATVLRAAERAWDTAAADARLPARRGHVSPVWVGTVEAGRVALVRARTARGPWLADVVDVASTPVAWQVDRAAPLPGRVGALVLPGPHTCPSCLGPVVDPQTYVLLPPGADDVDARLRPLRGPQQGFEPASLLEGLAGPFPVDGGTGGTPGDAERVVGRLALRTASGYSVGVGPCADGLSAVPVPVRSRAPSWPTVGTVTADLVDDAVLLAQSRCGPEQVAAGPLADVPGVGHLVELTAGTDRYLALRTPDRFLWRAFSTVAQVEGFRVDDGSGRATLVVLARPGVARMVLTVRGRVAARVEGRLLVHPLHAGDQSRSTLTAYDAAGRVLVTLQAQAVTPSAHG